MSMLAEPRPASAPMFDPIYISTTLFHDPEEGTVEDFWHGVNDMPWTLAAKKGKRDHEYPTYSEAVSGPHQDKFKAAQDKKIKELEHLKSWTVVDRPKDVRR